MKIPVERQAIRHVINLLVFMRQEILDNLGNCRAYRRVGITLLFSSIFLRALTAYHTLKSVVSDFLFMFTV